MKPIKKLDANKSRDYRDVVERRMARRKISYLGSGYYSAVFQHPRNANQVIKFGPLEDGWLVYAAWCEAQRSANNPHLPVIHSIRRYEKHGLYCAVMEKLEVTVGNAIRSENPPLINWSPVHDRFNFGLYSEAPTGWCYVEDAKWNTWLSDNKLGEVFENTLSRLRKFAIKHGLGRDLHGANAMLRKKADGTTELVLTDPFSEGNKAKLTDAFNEARVAA